MADNHRPENILHKILELFGLVAGPLLADSQQTIQAFETKCLRKLLCISYLKKNTIDWVQSKTNFLVGLQKGDMATVEKQKLASFEHVMQHDSEGTLEGGRCCDQHKR